jgi:aldose 1-epimerase
MFRITLVILMTAAFSMFAADPERKPFGTMPDGTVIEQFTLRNKNGMVAKFINYGGIITELHVPDKNGKTADVVLGFDNLKDYLDKNPYFGCITGRVANRIANGKFTLDGKEYTLATNNGPNHLHGGVKGFDKMVWKGEFVGDNAVKFSYRSPDGEEGYPGNLDVAVTYTIDNSPSWAIEFEAKTDKSTPVNLTQHAYFNLAGHNSGDVLSHELQINGDRYTEVDSTLIPTGRFLSVSNTPYDFREFKGIGARIKEIPGQPQGYDLNYLRSKGDIPTRVTPNQIRVAQLRDAKSGRLMWVDTDQPGLQLYTGNFLDGTLKGKGGVIYKQYAGLCLEAQKFPDAVNRPDFESVILKPGETYKQKTTYAFWYQ